MSQRYGCLRQVVIAQAEAIPMAMYLSDRSSTDT